MIIAHNMMAMNANRMYGINNKAKIKTTEKLSSGYRVNRAADDASGLAISEKMRRQIRGLHQAASNIQDGISYVQTAEGALNEVHDMLQRMNELAVKSANGTNTSEDREYIDSEVQQLKSELDRVFETTSFNEKLIWKGDVLEQHQETYYVDEPAVQFNATSNRITITNSNKAALPKVDPKLTATNDGLTVSWKGYNGTQYTSALIPWDAELAGNHSFQLADYLDKAAHPELEGIDINYSYQVHEVATLSDVIKSLNGKSISSYPSTTEYTQQYKNDSSMSGISTSVSVYYEALLASGKDMEAADTIFAEGSNSYQNFKVDLSDTANWDKPFSFSFDFANIGKVNATISEAYYYGSTANPESEGFWSWVKSGNSNYKSIHRYSMEPSNGSMNSVLYALENDQNHRNLLTDSTNGGSIYLQFNLVSENPFHTPDGSTSKSVGNMTLNLSVSGSDTKQDIVDRLQNLKGIDFYDDASPSRNYMNVYSGKSANSVAAPYERTVYRYDDTTKIPIQAGEEPGQHIVIEYEVLNSKVLGIGDTNVLDTKAAGAAINEIKEAQRFVSAQRADFGAYQNRLEHAYNIDENVAENTQAAESRIRDAEMDKEMVKLSVHNILAQAGESMLSQANQSSNGILSLLQ